MKALASACVWSLMSLTVATSVGFGQGLAMSAIGPVNSGMGGAATACPLESSGAIMWNPATISGLECSEVSLGVALVQPTAQIESRLPAGFLGGGFPPYAMSGTDRSETGFTPVPNMAIVEPLGESAWTFGLGVFGIGGFRVNYPASLTNPILTPPPPAGVGVGRLSANAQIMQILPTLSYAATEQLSVGLAPSISLAEISAESLVFAPPDDANQDGYPSYPSGRGGRVTWGGGLQLGVYYIMDTAWRFGAAVKSPQWFEPFRFKAADETGAPRTEELRFRYPLIATVGTAYTGIDRVVLAMDARFFDWGNAAGFRESGFAPDGSVAGFGWSSIFATCVGLQYEVCEPVHVRCGYSYNQNPIHDMDVSFNVASPVISQHFAYVGGSVQVSSHTYLSVAYIHGFENEVTGPIQTGFGAIPGSSVSSQVALDALTMGCTVQY
jgi:long-chain fatty acid transport protein